MEIEKHLQTITTTMGNARGFYKYLEVVKWFIQPTTDERADITDIAHSYPFNARLPLFTI